jgi:hypothetical protein
MSQTSKQNAQNPMQPPVKEHPQPNPGDDGSGFEMQKAPTTKRTPASASRTSRVPRARGQPDERRPSTAPPHSLDTGRAPR